MKGRTLADQKKVKKMAAGGPSAPLMHSQTMGPMGAAGRRAAMAASQAERSAGLRAQRDQRAAERTASRAASMDRRAATRAASAARIAAIRGGMNAGGVTNMPAPKSRSLLPSAIQQRLQTRMNTVKQRILDKRAQARPAPGGMKTGGISKRK